MSSTWRELTAIVFALESFLPLKGSYIKLFSDSQNGGRIIQVGSMRKDLHVIALNIFQFCVDNGIELEMQWIPRLSLIGRILLAVLLMWTIGTDHNFLF